MRSDTHIFVNSAVGLAYALHTNTSVGVAAGIMIAAMAIVPNIAGQHMYPEDKAKFAEETDEAGNALPGSKMVGGESLFGYRTATHWWMPYLGILMFSMPFTSIWGHIAFGIAVGGLIHLALDLFDEPGIPLLTPYGARIQLGGPAMETVGPTVEFSLMLAAIAVGAIAIWQWFSVPNLLQLGYSVVAIPWEVVADARWLANVVFGRYGTPAA
jgi:hypothetical protein